MRRRWGCSPRELSNLMTDFHDLIVPEAVAAVLPVTSKKQLFQKLAEIASSSYGLDPAEFAPEVRT